jgi:uncharacterized protein
VDIGVHHDGLVHISEISERYIKHPSEALTVGDVVRVRVIGVDPVKKRINLSMKSPDSENKPKEQNKEQRRPRDNRHDNRNRDNRRDNGKNGGGNNRERSLDDMLKALQNKFSKK